MLLNDKIIGQNVFVKINIKSDDGRLIPIATMGPICIENSLKRKGYGKKLLDFSLANLKKYKKEIVTTVVIDPVIFRQKSDTKAVRRSVTLPKKFLFRGLIPLFLL